MRFFTSDSHFGHERILTLGEGRPFRDLGHMHSVILKNAWSVMGPDDTLYHLGDAAMGNFDETIKLMGSLPGKKKYLVPGNHDKIFPKLNTRTRIERFRPLYEEAGYEILPLHPTITLEVFGKPLEVMLSHVPYSPERFEGRGDRLAFARPTDTGLWLIHGHTHSREKYSDHPREIHVGMDANNFTPVSKEAIVAHIEEVLARDARGI